MNDTVRWYSPNPDEDPEQDKRNRAAHLISETGTIESRQSSWHELNLWNATLYSNRELPGFRWGDIIADRELWPTNLRTENIIEEIGDAMLSKASSSPLKPTLVPHGDDIEIELAVRELDKFLFGVWRATRAEEAAIQVFLDAFISGMGCVRVAFDPTDKTLHVESVFFDNLIIDNRECINRTPPRTYRIRQVLPRAAVEARYGVSLDNDEVKKMYVEHRALADGWVVLVEAWRLPDAKGKGGRHTIACGGQLLTDEAYTDTWVPLIFFKWADSPSGWFNKSGVEQLVPFQNRQNDLNDAIELSQDIVCRPRLLVNANSMFDVNQWDNEAGRMILWSGIEPKPFEWRTNLTDLYHERERNKAAAYSHMGMSEMFTNADVPEGVRLDSSAGVREFRNMEDARHLRLWTRFEQFRLDIARTIIRVLGKASSKAADYTTTYFTGQTKISAEQITWDNVNKLKEDDFSWTLDATPLSALSPAARRELIRDWSSRGLIDSSEARRMEGNSNLERDEDLEMASDDDITRHLGILERGKYEAPTELTNIPLGVKRVTANYHRLKRYKNVRMKVLQNHITWVLTAMTIQQKLAAFAQNQQTAFAPTQGMNGTNAATPGSPPAAA